MFDHGDFILAVCNLRRLFLFACGITSGNIDPAW